MVSSTIQQLQLLQQNLQNVLLQKQQVQGQQAEIHSALHELKATSQAYKIIGTAMISVAKEELSRELQEQQELMEIRLKNLEKQEHSLQQNLERMQQDAVAELKSEKKSGPVRNK